MRLTSLSHRLHVFVALLALAAAAGAAAPAHVTVGACHWLDEAEAVKVTAAFSWSVSGADEYGTSTISRAWQVEAVLELTGAYGGIIEYGIEEYGDEPPTDPRASGSFAIEDVYAFDGHSDSARGAGALTDASLYVMVDSRTCAVDASFHVGGEADFQSPQGSWPGVAPIGDVHLFDVVTVEEFLGGTLELPHITGVGLEESHFFGGWFTTAETAISDQNLGTATFTWSIEPLGAARP